jgi:hypothetical protein
MVELNGGSQDTPFCCRSGLPLRTRQVALHKIRHAKAAINDVYACILCGPIPPPPHCLSSSSSSDAPSSASRSASFDVDVTATELSSNDSKPPSESDSHTPHKRTRTHPPPPCCSSLLPPPNSIALGLLPQS